MTKQRKIIYDIIMKSAEHLTAQEIFTIAKSNMPSIAFGTVYRNLGLMIQNGDIGKIELLGEPARFDKSNIPHCHKKCCKCGKVYDIKIEGVTDIISKNVTKFINYQLNINYICSECYKKDQKYVK
ncbi:MAG: transcriptional repressor [Clostridia bacterium]